MLLQKLSYPFILLCAFLHSSVSAEGFDFSEYRENAILIHVINDTDVNVDKIIVKTQQDQFFVCTMINHQCVVVAFQQGDKALAIKSQMESGDSVYGIIETVFPGSQHTIHVSQLNDRILF